MEELLLAISGIILGVSLAAPPGPITAILVDRSVRSVVSGVLVGMGAMTADFLYMILTFTFGNSIDLSRYDPVIFFLGSAFFIILAIMIVKGGGQESKSSQRSSYVTGLTMGLVNPMEIGWWLTAGLGFFQKFSYFPFYFMFAGIIMWVIFLSLLINKSVIRYGSLAQKALKIFSFVSLFAFAGIFVYLALADLGMI